MNRSVYSYDASMAIANCCGRGYRALCGGKFRRQNIIVSTKIKTLAGGFWDVQYLDAKGKVVADGVGHPSWFPVIGKLTKI